MFLGDDGYAPLDLGFSVAPVRHAFRDYETRAKVIEIGNHHQILV